jgi:SsrA-binding protein
VNNITIRNKKANFDYTILDTYTAGISLVGTEIKSVRNGDVSLAASFCYFNGRSLFLKNAYIAQYEHGFIKHEERRDRVLLLTKNELRRIRQAVKVQGVTVVPLKIFINDKGFCKVEIATAKGKKNYDKREAIKEKEFRCEKNSDLFR